MPITDWDDAYANGAHIPGAEAYPPRWAAAAAAFRADHPPEVLAYGPDPRQVVDLFRPAGAAPRGVCVVFHGGYWKAFGPSDWSHLAAGMLERGLAVAIAGYRLTPAVRVQEITGDAARAVAAAAGAVPGPIAVAGHSAGGHLACRMAVEGALPEDVARRLAGICSLSGLHDLRPLLATALNQIVSLDAAEAMAESPALLRPRPGTRLLAVVGDAERPEFRRQTDLIANVWTGLGAETQSLHALARHHFDVIDLLADPGSPVCRFLDPGGH